MRRARSPWSATARLSVLGILSLVAVVLGLMRLASNETRVALAEANPKGMSWPFNTAPYREVGPAVTWPIELRRDLFAWETVFASTRAAADRDDVIRRRVAEDILVQAIVFGDAPQAIVNGHVFRAGDSIGAYKVQRIERRYIVVERDGIEVQVDLRGR